MRNRQCAVGNNEFNMSMICKFDDIDDDLDVNNVNVIGSYRLLMLVATIVEYFRSCLVLLDLMILV